MHRLFLAATVAAISLAGPAAAETQTRSRTVSYADLDLATPSGVAALDKRIARAARKVCDIYDSRYVAERLASARCRSDAVARVDAIRREAIASATIARPALASAQ